MLNFHALLSSFRTRQFIISAQGRVYTFDETFSIASKLASYFEKRKIKGVVCIALPNQESFLFAVLALWLNQSIPFLINPAMLKKEMRLLPPIDAVVTLDKFKNVFLSQFHSVFTLPDSLDFVEKKPLSNPNPSDSAIIILTSGSESYPKAVLHMFSSLITSTLFSNQFIQPDKNKDKWILSLPLFHIGGFSIFLRALQSGIPIVFPNSISTENILSTIYENKITLASFVPTMLFRLVQKQFRFQHDLKYFFVGGGPCQEKIIRDALHLGYPISKVYGSSETAAMITASTLDETNRYPSSSGKVLSNQIKIRVKDSKLFIKSPTLLKKYYDELHKESHPKNINGWFFSGDLGSISKEGVLIIQGKTSNRIITGGKNVATKEVEEKILLNKKVSEVYVFGLPHQEWGEAVCAAIVLRKNQTASPEELVTFLRTELANYKIPKKMQFLSSLPLTSTGKVSKRELLLYFEQN